MVSQFEEEYLEALYVLSEKEDPIKTTSIAKHLNVAPASVTEMLQKLAKKGYIEYKKYYGVRFKEKGRTLARTIKRRHRLVECFLTDILGMNPEDVHEHACKMEHMITSEIEMILCRILDHPTACPDDKKAIPPCSREGDTCETCGHKRLHPITALKKGDKGTVEVIVEDHMSAKDMAALGLSSGMSFEIVDVDEEGVRFRSGKKSFSVAKSTAKKVLVERVRKES